MIRRLERDTLIACGALAIVAVAVSGGALDAGAAVVAGGALVAISYRGIKGGIDAALGGRLGVEIRKNRPNKAWSLVKFFTRYGILALAAYGIMFRLRLHVLWVLAGASSFVIAAAVEAVRVARRRHP